jgi:hypothetical protein
MDEVDAELGHQENERTARIRMVAVDEHAEKEPKCVHGQKNQDFLGEELEMNVASS